MVLMSTLILATVNSDTDFILWMDTLDTAIGGVLIQKQLFEGRMVKRTLVYFLRKLHTVKMRYPAYDCELLTISTNLEHWMCYVYGRKHTTVYTDHTLLQHIVAQNKLTSRQWHYLVRLQQHDYKVKYFPSAMNIMVDALSQIAYPWEEWLSDVLGHLNMVEIRILASTEWLDNIRKGYEEDAIFRPVAQNLNSSTKDEKERKITSKQNHRISERVQSYMLEECLLYHKPLDRKLCIPRLLRVDVIWEVHDVILGSGHNGISKTAAAVSMWYHWPKLIDSVAE